MLVRPRWLSHALSEPRLGAAIAPVAWIARILVLLAIRPARPGRDRDGVRRGHAGRGFFRPATQPDWQLSGSCRTSAAFSGRHWRRVLRSAGDVAWRRGRHDGRGPGAGAGAEPDSGRSGEPLVGARQAARAVSKQSRRFRGCCCASNRAWELSTTCCCAAFTAILSAYVQERSLATRLPSRFPEP